MAELEAYAMGMGDVIFENGHEKVRVYHCQRDGNDIFMFANEERRSINTTVTLPCNGKYTYLDLASDVVFADETTDGKIHLTLEPTQSAIICFGDNTGLMRKPLIERVIKIAPEYDLELASYEDLSAFENVGHFDKFFNVSGPNFKPTFSGKMKYTFNVDVEREDRVMLDLGRVGHCATLYVNGKNIGTRFAAPYTFDLTNNVNVGKNEVVVVVGNTLAQAVRDRFSFNMLIAPAGLLGDMSVKYYK